MTENQHSTSILKTHVKKTAQTLRAVLRISPLFDENKKKLIHHSMVKSQFNYWHLVPMFFTRQSTTWINKVQERARSISNDQQSSFQPLLDKYNESSAHQRRLQTLMIEIHKTINPFASLITNSFFVFC